jgi:ATP-dependent RNA helicase RhlE
LIDSEGDKCTNAIIFCNRKTDVDICATSLKKYGYDAAPIHGDLDQSQRTRTLDGFREGNIRFLVASDVAARGLDVPSVSHVFNYDVPGHAEDYVHRIGRTGRAGREGKAMMICVPRDEKNLDAIQKLLQKDIPLIDSPTSADAGSDQETRSDEKRPSRSRNRRSERRTAPDTKAARSEADQPETSENTANAPSVASEPRAPENASQKTREPRKVREPKRSQRERGAQNDGRNDPKVVGLGDHMPSFIALSFKER